MNVNLNVNLIIKPDDTDAEAAEVLVEGAIGTQPYTFLLDTGAARSCVLNDAYSAAFPAIEQRTSSGVFAETTDDVIVVPSIRLGPISKPDFTLVRSTDRRPDAHNLIGMDLLKDWCCHFRFAEQILTLAPSLAFPHATAALHPLTLDDRAHPYIGVQIGTASAQAVWDTGASITVVDLGFVEQNRQAFAPEGEAMGTDSTGRQMTTPMFRMGGTIIGGMAFAAHRVAGVDLSRVNATIPLRMDLIVGYSTFSQADWWFDFPQLQWAVLPR